MFTDLTRDVVVVGAGFGGLAAAVELRKLLPANIRVLLIDRRDKFSMGFMNLWLMTGEIESPRECLYPIRGVEKHGVVFVNEEVVGIDAARKQVKTVERVYEADKLVIALGAEYVYDAVPGFREMAYNFYELMGAYAAQNALTEFTGGRIAVLITRTPFKCPPAPYEAAFLVDAYIRRKNIRDKTSIDIYTPEPHPMPAAGKHVGQAVEAMLAEKGIRYHPKKIVSRVDPSRRSLVFEDGEASFDLLLGVPVHRAPQVVRDAGLVDETGWIPVNPYTMETGFEDVYAVGDVVAIKLKNGMFLPKAGVFAESMGLTAARRIAATVTGREAGDVFEGRGACYVEVGDGYAGRGNANFYADPVPEVVFEPPFPSGRDEKREFGMSRLRSWLL
ncbi:MAG: FAD-dependent oxidoreductase [Candidatus Caldarchaeum sp.]|nr:FAD-dependent oxidoreductase [Candidatus Caldarchaeum sp.]MDW8434908.1 FAD-dependent oxidoreductase [Candidatus Caldarchaeum sp.]